MTEYESNKSDTHPLHLGKPAQLQVEINSWPTVDDVLLQLMGAPIARRIELLEQLAERTQLSELDRRKALLGIKRYILARRGDLTSHAGQLLSVILKLGSQGSLLPLALRSILSVLEFIPQNLLATTAVEPVSRLVEGIAGQQGQNGLNTSIFLAACNELIRREEREAMLSLAGIGLFFFPYFAPLREIRAKEQMSRDDYEYAAGDLDLLLELFPDRASFRLLRAECLLKLDEFERALDDLEVFLKARPDHLRALNFKAEALSQVGQHGEAIQLLDRIIGNVPNNPEYRMNRARTFEQIDLFPDALKDLEEVLVIDPENHEARQMRQSMLLRSQSYGMEDDLYSAFNRGDEEVFLGEPVIPETRFSDLGGLEKVKQELRETILYPFKFKDISERYGKSAGGGMLMFGPPGCGKTLIARAAAGECGVYFVNVNLSTVLDKWVGNSEKAVSMIFKAARKRSPSIIFLDEVDAIGGSRAAMQAGWEKKLISQLLIELDGLTSDNQNVMVLAASNAPWDVDFALRRPGRLGRLVFVPPPDADARSEIFQIYLERKKFVSPDIDYKALGQSSEHFSADAIRHIVEEAASIPWRSAIEGSEPRPISESDIYTAMSAASPDLAEWERLVSRYKEFADRSLKRPGIGFTKSTMQPNNQ